MKVKTLTKWIYGISGLGKDMMYALSTILFVYFTDFLKLDVGAIGIVFAIARIWDGINDPIMGWIVDNTVSKLGKFRLWILIGAVLNAIVIIVLFSHPDLPQSNLLIFASLMYILWGMSYTMNDIPFWSMIPALSSNQKERENIAVLIRIFTNLGFFSISALYLKIVDWFGQGDDLHGFFIMAVVIAGIFALSQIILAVTVKEETNIVYSEKLTFKGMWNLIRNNDQLFVVMITIIVFNTIIYITTTVGYFFFIYDVGRTLPDRQAAENLFVMFTLLAGVSQIITIAFFPLLSKILERKQIFILSTLFPFLAYAVLFSAVSFLNANQIVLYIGGVLLFIGLGLSAILQTVMLSDTVDYGEYKLHRRSESVTFSVQTLVVKFAGALSAGFVGLSLKIFGFVPDMVQSAQTIMGIRFIMFAVPMLGLSIPLFIFLRYYKIDKTYYADMMAQLKIQRLTEKL